MNNNPTNPITTKTPCDTHGKGKQQQAIKLPKTIEGSSTEVPEQATGYTTEGIVRTLREVVESAAMDPTRQMIGRYWSPVDFVLQNGRSFMPPKSDVLPPGVKRYRSRNYFRNAINVLASNEDLIYVEGFAAGVRPEFHAWLVDREGHVIDPTWRGGGTAYFGVPIKTKYMCGILSQTNRYGVIYAYEIGYPILKDPESKWRVSIKSAA